jgi:hypothetical protein
MKDSFNISLSSIFCIHRNNTAIGAIIINIHKYIILINARTHKTSISIANTTVVHHWIIVLSIVAFANLSLEVFTLVTTSVFKILNHIKYNGHATSSGLGISESIKNSLSFGASKSTWRVSIKLEAFAFLVNKEISFHLSPSICSIDFTTAHSTYGLSDIT